MNIYTRTPYTYLIMWSNTGMKYYGVRYAKNCHPSELFVTYFTSSNNVADYIKLNGYPDIIQVRKVFDEISVDKARQWEHIVLRRINAIHRNDFLNKTDNIAFELRDSAAEIRRVNAQTKTNAKPETKEKRRKSAKALWQNPEWAIPQLEKLKKIHTDPDILNKRLETESKPDTKLRRSNAQKNAQNRPEVLAAQSESHRGAKHGMYDHTVYVFEHVDGRVVHSTRFEFENNYNMPTGSVGKLVRGEQKTSIGWKLVGKE
jgi:hypothetical protein